MAGIERLTMVWNADSGTLNAFKDLAKKLLNIGDCSLCDITHRGASERPQWSQCWLAVGVPVELLHRDETSPALREVAADGFPCVVGHTEDATVLLLGPAAIARCDGSIDALRDAVADASASHGLSLTQQALTQQALTQ